MKASEIRQKYLDFFVKLGHKIIPAAPLVPENDPTTLFTSAGMQQLVPYLKGAVHPMGRRLVDSQPSIRLGDIEEIGDTSHTTFFEMLGNWSLGDYFKKEQLPWFFEFLTKELGLASERLYVSVFEGTTKVVKDDESVGIWRRLGIPQERIFYYPAEKNWWSISGTPEQMVAGDIGGPDSEVFFDFGSELRLHEKSPYAKQQCHPNCQCGRFLEIGNSVFIQYQKNQDGTLSELPQKNVDFGGGLERLAAAANDDPDIFNIDLFASMIRIIEAASQKSYLAKENQKAMRIIADHIRAAVFIANEGVKPDKEKQGYVLRRLIRNAYDQAQFIGSYDPVYKTTTTSSSQKLELLKNIIGEVINIYKNEKGFEEIVKKHDEIMNSIVTEINSYCNLITTTTLPNVKVISGEEAFKLHSTHGISPEQLRAKGYDFDQREYEEEFKKHQELSRTASAGMFKGGLADHSEEVTKLHTATHLLHTALRKILGEYVQQKGSNITAERLRFDFLHPRKLTEEEIRKIEELINQKITENLPVTMEIMDLNAAEKTGALGFFRQKYGQKVKVYSIGPFSKEICGGPHVNFTGSLGRFKIIKEEAAGAGLRRIYATLNSN